ncbi:MAG TPA: tetratricopeptide repeat protein, partial [Chthoniobacterales bacterium]|nr:tetratricopeptide repeat protein [Chthoniobacterales bacterium]
MKKCLCLIAALALAIPQFAHAQKKEEVQKFGREGMEAQRNKNWSKAISAFKHVVALEPTSQNHENLGIVYRNAGNAGEAIKSFTAAIQANADNVSAYGNRASAL